MIMLQDAPGGPALIAALAQACIDLALLYANTPDRQAAPHLESFLGAIRPVLLDAVGDANATKVIDAVRRGVIGRKHLMEANGASRA